MKDNLKLHAERWVGSFTDPASVQATRYLYVMLRLLTPIHFCFTEDS